MNALDVIVIAGIALSALFAFARGFVKEALSIAAWVGAALIALYGLDPARPIAHKFITSPMLADAAAGLTLFLGSLIVLSLLTSMLASRVKQSALSAVDRALGLLFGIVRGVVLACLGFIALSWAIPQEKDWPGWVRESRTRPLLASGAETLKSFVPAAARERGAATAVEAQKGIDQAREAEQLMRALTMPTPPAPQAGKPGTPPPTGYKPAERKEMDRLFQTTQ